ncbi:MAG: M14 family metallopeptidase [Pseudanabaenaceae cyanobacterium]
MVQTPVNPHTIPSSTHQFPQLQVLDQIPDGLLDLEPHQLADFLRQPTLIHLSGLQDPPLFVSVLLHGNETTGWLAMRELLRKYQDGPLPRSLSLFIGNISAARCGLRHFPDQPDYNRIWAGDANSTSLEEQMAQRVIAEMQQRGVFASIDIHNNTGRNPHYGCITRLDSQSLFLAKSFAPVAVYYTAPTTTQAYAFAKLCPAIILESGQPNLPDGTAHALEFVEQFLHLTEIPCQPMTDLALFHTVAILKVPEVVTFEFGNNDEESAVNLRFPEEMDHMNFCELAAGTVVAHIENETEQESNCLSLPLIAWDESGQDQTERFLTRVGNQIQLRQNLMPAMITLNCEIVRSDCLCYLMERYPV